MKTYALAAFALLAVAFLPSAQQQPKDGPMDRLQVVERDLAQAKDKLARQETELAELKAWMAAQQAAAKAMQATLDESEQAGFTYGINPESRTTLLRGWRAQLEAAGRAGKSTSVPAKRR